MPLDPSALYTLGNLRVDGRRWNELRRLHANISPQAAADGSSYLEMGNTKVMCVVHGPREQTRGFGGGGGGGGGRDDHAKIEVEIGIAGFSGMERKKRSRTDRRTQEMQHTVSAAFTTTVLTQNYPHSTISIVLHILSQDGSLLAACLNAATLALIDAGVPMTDYIAACTTASAVADDDSADPLLDLNGQEELELPSLTLATSGVDDRVLVLIMETRVPVARIEGMLAVAVDGCRHVRRLLDASVREHGRGLIRSRV